MTTDRNDFIFTESGRDPPLQTVVETLDDGLCICDEEMYITGVDETFAELVGYGRDELVGNHVSEFVDENLLERGKEHLQALRSGERDVGELLAEFETEAGETRVVEFRGTPLSSDGEFRGIAGLARDVTERKERERELARFKRAVEASGHPIYMTDTDGRITYVNPAFEELTGYTATEARGRTPRILQSGSHDDAYYKDLWETVLAGEVWEGEITDRRKSGEVYHAEQTIAPVTDENDELDRFVAVQRDITERKERERKLERQRDELETLTRIHRLIEEVIQELTTPATREELERLVCARLTESELYTSAAIVEFTGSDERISPRTWAGLDDEFADAVAGTDPATDDGGDMYETIRTGTPYVIQQLSDERGIAQTAKDGLLDRGVESAIGLPLADRGIATGALVVHADRPAAFGEREQAAFETLAEITSFAITALENQQLLFADAVVELTLRASDSEAAFVTLSERLACRCTLEGLTIGREDIVICYLTIVSASPEGIQSEAESIAHVERCRVVSQTGEDEVLAACALSGGFYNRLLTAGASVGSAVADRGEAEVVVELASAEDVSDVVDAVEAFDPTWELAGKRTVDRPVQTIQQWCHEITERLTDKQLQALQAAFLAGYYEHPRESTAQEVAETLGISDATFHEHLQTAQRKLLEEFFEGTGLTKR